MGNLCNFREKKVLSRKIMYFFGFLPPINKNKKKTLKSQFLGRIFFFIQIAYIIFVKSVFI